VIPVGQFLPGALAVALEKAPLTTEKVQFAWRLAVGPAIARAASVYLAGSDLVVTTKDAAWGREVERSASIIRIRMNGVLGANVVRGLRVTSDATP
jgi:hypothetical protein